jgi:2'-5' RNA ligase
MDSDAVRVFYAIVPPPGVAASLAALAKGIGQRVRARAVRAGNIHLTLAFVGAWPLSGMPSVKAAAEAVHGEPFRLTLDTLGSFRRAGIAWVGPSHPPPQLVTLATSLGEALLANDVTYDARVFRPHVTLARRLRAPGPDGTIDPLEWDVDAFSLMESHTTAQGMCYETLATWPLGAPAGQ